MDINFQHDQVLSSWKEIAAFFGKGVRTVQRWEHELNLPVQRPSGDKKIVFARTGDLARWMGQQPSSENVPSLLLQGATDRVERLRSLVLNMQKQTERLQTNTARFLQHYTRVSEKERQPSRKAS